MVLNKKGEKSEDTEYVRNAEVREQFIETRGRGDYQRGYDAFYKLGEQDEKWKKLRDIPPPVQYEWIFGHFLKIWQGCEWSFGGTIIFTYRQILDYEECMHVPFRVRDKELLMKMKAWACNQIAEMKED